MSEENHIVPLTDIYQYQSNTGLVIPDTSNVQSQVIEGLKNVFGADFEYIPETPNGLLVDALTQLIKQFIGITAQNVNGLNVTTSIGSWLDAIGRLFGVEREDTDTDYTYRKKILQSCSRGSGFVPSIYNAIYQSSANGIYDVCVLNNGHGVPAVLPNQTNGIAVDPHSVFISVRCDTTLETTVAEAIAKTISAGCGFHNDTHGTKVEKTVEIDGFSSNIVFYHPTERFVKVVVAVNPSYYTGTNIQSDITNAVNAIIGANTTNATVSKSEFLAKIAATGTAIIPLSVGIFMKDSSDGAWTESEDYIVMPYQYVDIGNVEVVVE